MKFYCLANYVLSNAKRKAICIPCPMKLHIYLNKGLWVFLLYNNFKCSRYTCIWRYFGSQTSDVNPLTLMNMQLYVTKIQKDVPQMTQKNKTLRCISRHWFYPCPLPFNEEVLNVKSSNLLPYQKTSGKNICTSWLIPLPVWSVLAHGPSHDEIRVIHVQYNV